MNEFTIFTVKQFSERHPALKQSVLRWQVFNSDKNGLEKSGAIKRVGKRVYIIGERYQAWIDANGKA